DNGDDVTIVEHGVAGIHRGRLREVAFDECTALCARVDDVFHRAVRKGGKVPKEVRTPVPATDLGDDERIEAHAATPSRSNRRGQASRRRPASGTIRLIPTLAGVHTVSSRSALAARTDRFAI